MCHLSLLISSVPGRHVVLLLLLNIMGHTNIRHDAGCTFCIPCTLMLQMAATLSMT